MTSRDFLSAESANTDRIVLYREGLFWKAYGGGRGVLFCGGGGPVEAPAQDVEDARGRRPDFGRLSGLGRGCHDRSVVGSRTFGRQS